MSATLMAVSVKSLVVFCKSAARVSYSVFAAAIASVCFLYSSAALLYVANFVSNAATSPLYLVVASFNAGINALA